MSFSIPRDIGLSLLLNKRLVLALQLRVVTYQIEDNLVDCLVLKKVEAQMEWEPPLLYYYLFN